MKKNIKNNDIDPSAGALAPVKAPPPALELALRALLAAALVCGLISFICEAFGFDFLAVYPLACMLSCALFALMSLSRRLFAFGALGIVLAGGAWALFAGEPLRRLALALDALMSGIVARLTDAGFSAFSPFDLGVSSAASGDPARDLAAALALASVLLCALVCACTLHRVRLLLPALTVALVLGYVFVYNLSRSSWPLVLVASAAAGILALRVCDGKKLRASASGSAGYAGIAAALVSALALCPAAALIKAPAPSVPVVDESMQVVRSMVTSAIMGDLPSMLDLGFSGYMETFGDRSTETSDRVYSGKEIMTVQTGLPATVYLRSWVGVDYSENSWRAADAALVTRWRELFGEDFTPELLTNRFFGLIDPELTALNSMSSSANRSEHGFITTFVDVRTNGSGGNLLALPTVFNAERGLFQAGSRSSESYTAASNSYFDGVHTTDWTNYNRSYRALAQLPTFASPEYETTILRDFAAHATLVGMAERYFNLGESSGSLFDGYAESLRQLSLTERVRELFAELDGMSADERARWYQDYIGLPAAYGEYVNSVYTSTGDEGEWLYTLRDEIAAGILEKNLLTYLSIDSGYPTLNLERQHIITMAVLEYLRDNCTYTLTPRRPSAEAESYSALRAFLEDTHEGYCVQFATSAVLLLRSFGIPARYAEGYIADDFARNNADDRDNYYISTVRDYNAHAWVEVYYADYGWMPYEATPPYMSGMYDKTGGISTLPPETQPSEPIDTVTPTEPEELPEENPAVSPASSSALPVAAVITVLALAAAAALALFIRGAVRVRDRREALMEGAIYGAPDGDVRRRCARETADGILSALSVLGLSQRKGELPLDFADRVDAALLPSGDGTPELAGGAPSRLAAAEIFPLIEREEFGGGMSAEELSLCGEYMRDLHRFAYKNAGIFKKIYLRYVKSTL